LNYLNCKVTRLLLVVILGTLNCIAIIPIAVSQPILNNSTSLSDPTIQEQRLPGAAPPKTIESSPQPMPLTDEQRQEKIEELQETNTVPDIPRSPEPVLGPTLGTQLGVNNTQTNLTTVENDSATIQLETRSTNQITNETSNFTRPDLVVVENKTITPGSGSLSYTMESSLANKDDLVFYTGNWFAARSIDGGLTWGYISPYTSFRVFCCDQDVIYDSKHDIFIWYRQGANEPENDLSIGVSKDTFTWRFYTFSASDINSTWIDQFSDYPTLALSNNYLYISMNMFFEDRFSNPLMVRISLEDLADPSGIGPSFDYFVDFDLPRTSHTFTPIQGAKDTMYWGIHLSTSEMRLYEWNDSMTSDSVKYFDRQVPAWTLLVRGEGHCPGPDGGDWCIRGQSKIRGAFMANDIIGFFWDANAGGRSTNNATFAWPYVDAATFDTNTNMTYTSRPYLWSPSFAWMYGFGSPDDNGNVAIQAFYGGGQYFPSIAAGVGNDFSGKLTTPWNMIQLAKGTHGPTFTSASPPSWGDYLRIRDFNGDQTGWVGSGWILSGGNTPAFIIPYYYELMLQGNNNSSVTELDSQNRDQTQQNSTSFLMTSLKN
jgi:hypothetical protein